MVLLCNLQSSYDVMRTKKNASKKDNILTIFNVENGAECSKPKEHYGAKSKK